MTYFKPFQIVAGSGDRYSRLESAQELLDVIKALFDDGVVSPTTGQRNRLLDRDRELSEIIKKEWPADYDEDVADIDNDLSDLLIELATDFNLLPASTSLHWENGCFGVFPYIDDDAVRIEDTPDYFYTVNDHGNVTCYSWDEEKSGYTESWAMV